MKVDIGNVEDSKCVVVFTLEEQETEKEYKKILQDLQKRTKVNGFRPGKVPRSILEEQYGRERILSESIMFLIEQEVQKIVKEKEFEVIGRPNVDLGDPQSIKIGEKPIEVKVTFELKPKVELPDYHNFEIKVPISEENSEENQNLEKEKIIRRLAQSYANWEDCEPEATIQEDDRVFLDYKGYFPGEETEIEGEGDQDVPFIIKNDEFVPGGDQQLLGLKLGEEKEVKTKMLDEDPNEKIAGKEVVFKVTVKKIQRTKELEINDQLAEKLGKKDLKELEESVLENLKQIRADLLKKRVNVLIIHRIITCSELKIPEWLIQKELDSDQSNQKEEKELSPEQKKLHCENRIKLNLLLSEIVVKEKINIGQEELVSNTEHLWNFYQGLEGAKKPHQKNNKQIPKAFYESVLEDMLFKKVESWLFEHSKIETVDENEESLEEYNQKIKELETLGVYK